jgi:hypothetical protein
MKDDVSRHHRIHTPAISTPRTETRMTRFYAVGWCSGESDFSGSSIWGEGGISNMQRMSELLHFLSIINTVD